MLNAPNREATARLIPRLTEAVGENFLDAVSEQDMDEVAMRPGGLLAAVELLRSSGFNLLLDIGGTDHHPLTPRFEVSYHFLRIPDVGGKQVVPDRFRMRVFPNDLDPHVPSLTGVWPNADWAEREAYDLFGIIFDGHPDLRRLLMPDDWKGHPLRKDYPLRGFERRFVPGGRIGAVPPLVDK
jgi:NADH-quinone oxidoreductase subunit C